MDFSEDGHDLNKMTVRAERLYKQVHVIDDKIMPEIARKLIDYKNNFYSEYDEDDENLDFEKIDASEFEVSVDDL